jgi:trimeric autotransporter adhesin
MKPLNRALLLAAACAAAVGCSDDQYESPTEAPGPVGRMRLINASPAAATVQLNLLVVEKPTVSAAFKGATNYVVASPGSRAIAVQQLPEHTVRAEGSVDVQADVTYSVVAAGASPDVELFTIVDNDAAPAAGNVKVRAVHASTVTGDLDVYVTASGVDLATVEPDVEGLDPLTASAYIERPAGAFLVRFTTAGTKTEVLSVTIPATVVAGQVRSVYAVQALAATTLEGVTITDPAQ